MQLILSTNKPWNTNYCNEDGQVLYKADSRLGLTGRTVKISRVLPPVIHEDAEAVNDAELRDVYEHLAELDFRVFKSSRIKYQLVDQSVSEFFRKGGFSFWGRNRIFNGPDGREYVWKLTSRVCKLFLNDTSNTPVAVFHRKRLGIFRARRPASLEIFPEGQQIIDLILVTFIYVEKLRDEREKAAQHSGGP